MVAGRPSLWQKVLHGGANEMRREVAAVLLATKGEKSAFRYACCGLGDHLVRSGDAVTVSPRGCGHKLCPRCGRRRGGRYARRIIGWLAHESHGELFSMCLTQRVVRGETIDATRKRLAGSQRAYMRWLTGQGLVGAMTVSHPNWSTRSGGWHFHTHILVEMEPGRVTPLRLRAKWRLLRWGESVRVGQKASARVIGAGGPIAELKEDGGDADFWHESASRVAKAVQYPLRDLVQGITAVRLGGDAAQLRRCAEELVTMASGWKMYRAWGRWRKPCPAAAPVAEVADGEAGDKAAAPACVTPLGTVGRLWRAARKGDGEARDAFRLLELSCRNRSDFARRFVTYCRAAWSSGDSS